jgi:leucyl aminopeptidase (aminopeptidase T)
MIDFRSFDVIKAAHMLVSTCLGVKTGEQVLIVADNLTDFNVANALASAVSVAGGEPVLTVMPARPRAGEDPPEIVKKAAEGAQVVISPASTSLSHTRFIQRLLAEKKIRFCTMPAVTSDQMSKGAAIADYREVRRITERIAQIMKRGKKIRVTSPIGTDVSGIIEGMPVGVAAAFALNPGDLSCFPDGEAWQGPRDGTAEGVIVIDTSIHMLGLLNEPIKYIVKSGRVVSFEGGKEAQKLREIVESAENGNNIAEISIGTNPKARVTGNVSEDKKGLGRVHVALGDNVIYGGTVESPIHLDGVILRPTVEIDGNTVVRDGKLLLGI